jgi:hypothetical protein
MIAYSLGIGKQLANHFAFLLWHDDIPDILGRIKMKPGSKFLFTI